MKAISSPTCRSCLSPGLAYSWLIEKMYESLSACILGYCTETHKLGMGLQYTVISSSTIGNVPLIRYSLWAALSLLLSIPALVSQYLTGPQWGHSGLYTPSLEQRIKRGLMSYQCQSICLSSSCAILFWMPLRSVVLKRRTRLYSCPKSKVSTISNDFHTYNHRCIIYSRSKSYLWGILKKSRLIRVVQIATRGFLSTASLNRTTASWQFP